MPLKKKAVKKALKRAVKKPTKKPAKKTIRKILVKKIIKKSSLKTKPVKAAKKNKESALGKVTHYFPHVRAAVVKLKSPLTVGDTIKIKGYTTDFKQTVNSIQVDHVSVQAAKKGQEIGLLVNSRVRQHDMVYKA